MNVNGSNLPPLKDTTPVECENCKGDVFSQGFKLREVSRFITGGDKNGIIPYVVFYCVKCNHVNEQFTPKDYNGL